MFLDEKCVGVKTGFTDNAGRCLVHATKQDDGMELITVVLNCGNMCDEADRLNKLACSNFNLVEHVKPYSFVGTININNGSDEQVNVATIKGFKTVVKIGEEVDYNVEYNMPKIVEAPIKNGDKVGSVIVKYKDQIIFEDNLISIDDVDNIDFKFMLDNILNKWYA